jgi:hypothetical protein
MAHPLGMVAQHQGAVRWNDTCTTVFELLSMMTTNPQRYLARLAACRLDSEVASYDESEVAGLPSPVQRYFRSVLRSGQPMVATARVSHAGAFRTGESSTGWRPFRSTEVFTTMPPGFVWDAFIRMFPGLRVHVVDSYVGGNASMFANMLGFIPIVNANGAPELDAGALQRYLAEAVWFPTALLPSQGVQWQPIDELKALATLKDGATRVSLEFEFNRDGEIVAAFAPARYREVKGSYEPTPWACRYAKYTDLESMRIPMEIFYEYMTAETALTAPEIPTERSEPYRER